MQVVGTRRQMHPLRIEVPQHRRDHGQAQNHRERKDCRAHICLHGCVLGMTSSGTFNTLLVTFLKSVLIQPLIVKAKHAQTATFQPTQGKTLSCCRRRDPRLFMLGPTNIHTACEARFTPGAAEQRYPHLTPKRPGNCTGCTDKLIVFLFRHLADLGSPLAFVRTDSLHNHHHSICRTLF